MKFQSSATGKRASMPAGLAAGTMASLGIILLGAAIIAMLIHKEILEEDKLGYGVMILLIAASYLGSRIGYGWVSEKRMIVSGLVGMIMMVLLLSLTALFFDGQYNGIGVTILLILCGCALASLPVRQGKGPGKQYKFKM